MPLNSVEFKLDFNQSMLAKELSLKEIFNYNHNNNSNRQSIGQLKVETIFENKKSIFLDDKLFFNY